MRPEPSTPRSRRCAASKRHDLYLAQRPSGRWHSTETKTMANFTPVSAAIGGALIGLSAVLLMLLAGRIAGISGIVGESLNPGSDKGWRLAFLAGLVAVPLLAALFGFPAVAPSMPNSLGLIVVSGLLVGFGTRIASGCTSGHGICGIARVSPRSLAATAIFMASAIVVVFLTRHVVG